MYLTRLQINTESYAALRVMNSQERMHALVAKAIEGQPERGLWRLDALRGRLYLLILSEHAPDMADAQRQIGFPDCPAETKDYAPLLARIEDGSVWHFRLTANPTESKPAGPGQRGRVQAVTVASAQRQWLARQAEKHGFALMEDGFDVVRSEWKLFQKGWNVRQSVTLLQATFEGVLTVTDTAAFRNALTKGIGRAKAYGMGMLTVVSHG